MILNFQLKIVKDYSFINVKKLLEDCIIIVSRNEDQDLIQLSKDVVKVSNTMGRGLLLLILRRRHYLKKDSSSMISLMVPLVEEYISTERLSSVGSWVRIPNYTDMEKILQTSLVAYSSMVLSFLTIMMSNIMIQKSI